MKTYRVYLYRAPECIRGWLAYLTPSSDRNTVTVELQAKDGPKAKNMAQTLANRRFEGMKVVAVNLDDKTWGLNLFPDLAYVSDLVTP